MMVKVESGTSLKGSRRVGVLAPYPEIVKEVKDKLEQLRVTRITIDQMLGQSIFIAVITACKLEILTELKFKCSDVRHLTV